MDIEAFNIIDYLQLFITLIVAYFGIMKVMEERKTQKQIIIAREQSADGIVNSATQAVTLMDDVMGKIKEEYGRKIEELEERVEQLTKFNVELSKKVKKVESNNKILMRHNELLSGQVVGAGIVPVEMPSNNIVNLRDNF